MVPTIEQLREWARELGFGSLGVADIDLSDAEAGLAAWLKAGFHGELDYMARHGMRRARPAELVPGTVSAVMVTMPYAPVDPDWVAQAWATLEAPSRAYVSRYALGRDYHKVVRARLQQLADRIAAAARPFGHRVFCDSAPVLEVELARRAGLGWRGKHTLLIHPRRGSMSFLGTLYTDLPLTPTAPRGVQGSTGDAPVTVAAPVMAAAGSVGGGAAATGAPGAGDARIEVDAQIEGEARIKVEAQIEVEARIEGDAPIKGDVPIEGEAFSKGGAPLDGDAPITSDHCGRCRQCIDVCPTGAIVAPWRLDARRCISYLTIELKGSIPVALRPAIGNRIYGCDDCQLICPWNKFAQKAAVPDFATRHGLDRAGLIELFAWSRATFEANMAGSAIRRIGHERWSRNLAVALGNALRAEPDPDQARVLRASLSSRADDPSALVREHVAWALEGAPA